MLTVKITPNDKGNPPGKLADAEIQQSRLQQVEAELVTWRCQQQEVVLREEARAARAEFYRAVPAPVSRRQRLQRQFNE